MSASKHLLVGLFRALTHMVFRVHAQALSQVPLRGPLIIVMNHINILEIPLIYAHLQPRRVRGLVLANHWKNPLLAWGLNACEAIPLERGAGNFGALKRALEALDAGEIVLIMPEGTRSGHGRLQRGYPGVIGLAVKSNAPLLPVVSFGGEGYQANLIKLRRTDCYLAVGTPFRLEAEEAGLSGQARQQMIDEVMLRLAALLPPAYQGAYASPPPTQSTT